MATLIRDYPRHVAQERPFVVTYVKGTCTCENCHRRMTITALDRQDAQSQFQARCPFGWVVRID